MQLGGRLYVSREAAAAALIVAMWCRSVGSQIVLSLTADKSFVPVGDDILSTPASNLTSKLFYLLAVGIAAAIVVFRLNDVTRPGLWRIVVLLAPWLVMVTLLLYYASPTPDSVLYVLVALAIAALRPNPRVLIVQGALVVVTAAIAVAFGFLIPDAGLLRDDGGTVRVRADKATFPSLGLLQGMFTSENNLGQYLAIGSASLFLLPRPWLRLSGFALTVFAVCWSSSRSSMFALACMIAVGFLVWVPIEFGWRRTASAIARIGTGTAIAVMCAIPFLGWEDDAFTERGLIWNGALGEWRSGTPWTGLGHDWFARIAKDDTSPLNDAAYQGHNQMVQFLVTGGILLAVAAVAYLVVVTYCLTTSNSRYMTLTAMLVTGIAVSGFLEVPIGFVDRSMFWTVTFVPLAVLFFARPTDTRVQAEAR